MFSSVSTEPILQWNSSMSKRMRLWLMPLVIVSLRSAIKQALAKLRSRSLLDMTWAEESYLLSPYRVPDPADKTLKHFFGDEALQQVSPWFPRKKVTHW